MWTFGALCFPGASWRKSLALALLPCNRIGQALEQKLTELLFTVCILRVSSLRQGKWQESRQCDTSGSGEGEPTACVQVPQSGWDKHPGLPAVPSHRVTHHSLRLGLCSPRSVIRWVGSAPALCGGRRVGGLDVGVWEGWSLLQGGGRQRFVRWTLNLLWR